MHHRAQQRLFTLIMLLVPLLFFALLEGGLRLVGYGDERDLFIENPVHPNYLLPEPHVIKRYFPRHGNASGSAPAVSLEANFFLKEKPPNGLRLFVQGGSTAAGYPYGLGASLAGMLDNRLRLSYPSQHVEVINTALSAVNSFTLLDFSADIIQQQPDAVLIYAGHNEYLGILGVGSQHQIASHYWLTRTLLWLKDFRLYQWIENTATRFTHGQHSTGNVAADSRRSVMSQVAKNKNIALDSAVFSAGVEQFERNMTALLERYHRANIPVYIATIASNEKDHSPFESTAVPANFAKELRQSDSGERLKALARRYSGAHSAELHFTLAQALFSAQLPELAKHHYRQAKEHDLLRFRAPEAINQVIRRLARREGVYLVDTQHALAQRSEHNVIGNNLMLEHLHPNLQGYFVIANTFYEAIAGNPVFKPERWVDINRAWRARSVLPSEEYYGYASVQTLKSDYPFTDSPQPVTLAPPGDWQQALGKQRFEGAIDWLGMARKAALGYEQRGNTFMQIKSLMLIADALPHDPQANLSAGEKLYSEQRFTEALYYLERAQRAGTMGERLERQIDFARHQSQRTSTD
ncbi:SGNH/GDSL hydrolase family protein [Alteromonas oceanisediminis]|uniref:SGNH/GDSL hydrolase family protein n=1 Tax=Alteromonas oceanisediminis TaxID=2836180 RepID=UPI001BD942AF|nr:SGNH/GDSL hydrolase family protein [Alteromonas oceanisediminis]MBT0586461.1 hypothetical protein [Alteromonas oceanisediminis]